ncbi:hypothetical protein M942_24800 [Enterobacter ludwigii]|nr:hypothetical protein M942_24800 [Enterobacter ludwigii]
MAFAFVKSQIMLADIRRTGDLQPQVMRPFAPAHAVADPLMTGERLAVRLLAVHRGALVTCCVSPPATEHGDIGLCFINRS